MKPLVTILIPVYNGEAYIAQAVDSALAQDHPHKEIIVINDGSTDGSMAILARYGAAIRVIDQVNGGPPRARNVGLRAAQGDYIAFLDADDIWLPGKISAQVAHMEACPEVGACYTAWHVWPADEDGVFRPPAFASRPLQGVAADPKRSGWIYDRLLFDCELLTTTVMLRTTVARAVGEFNEKYWNGDDYDYWLRISQVGQISRLDAVGALYRVVQGSVSRKPRPVNFELVVIEGALARFGLRAPQGGAADAAAMQRRLDHLVFQYGYSHWRNGDARIALQSFCRNLRFAPWRPRLWLLAVSAGGKLFWRSIAPVPA